MFGEISQLDEMKDKLNQISPSFCLAKWMHCTIHLLTGHTHSCYLPPTHKVPLEEIKKDPSALHNTEYKKQVRKMMLEGIRPKECSICWSVEDLPGNNYSDRHYRGVDSWTMPYYDKVKSMKWDENINPSYVEVSWSNACNFKCMYCSPAVSSEWMKEVRSKGSYQLSRHRHQDLMYFQQADLMPIDEDSNPYIDAFWKWWPDLVKDLLYFRITGGEPLLSRHTFRLLEWFQTNPQPHLSLSVNSNLGVPDKQFSKFIGLLKDLTASGKVRSHHLHTSLDTWGPQAEYIRNGLNFKIFEDYVERYFNELPDSSIAIMCTFNVLSVVGFRYFLEWLLEQRERHHNGRQRLLVDLPHLQTPEMFACKILSSDYYHYMESHIEFMEKNQDEEKGFRKAEIYKMNRIFEWMKNFDNADLLSQYRKDFFLFIQEHDIRRNTNFLETFPEMESFYKLCEQS